MRNVRAITLDLDDTLWPIAPTMERAERVLHAWFATHAPTVAERFDARGLRALRERVAREQPDLAHDFTRMRHQGIALALRESGHDPALADDAFAAFFVARNRVDLYDDVESALTALSARFPLVAITNGNADVHQAGVGHHFQATVSARGFGIGKPDPRIFEEACRLLDLPAAQVLHVGDDWALDVVGARAAGLKAAWLRRDVASALPATPDADTLVIAHLGELVDALGASTVAS